MGMLDGNMIILGISGGIAAYRACELARLLVKDGALVQAVMTQYASKLVGPLTLQALTGQPVEVGDGGQRSASGMAHIDLAQAARLVIIAPATANTLAKLAHGMADNLLTTLSLTAVGRGCPLLLAPAMNTDMWNHPMTQENIHRLKKIESVMIVGPAGGLLACGQHGLGRMEEPDTLHQAARFLLSPHDYAGLRVIVTAGPTREPLDPVRYLSNRSSGKMGYALAEAARRRGARVVLVTGPTSIRPPWGVDLVETITAADMGRIVDEHLQHADALIMAAAVADFRPRSVSSEKIKKNQDFSTLHLEPTRDIIASIGNDSTGMKRPLLVGFAAETEKPDKHASKKLREKNIDLVVVNDVTKPGAGFDVDTNLVSLVDKQGITPLPMLSKRDVADRILDKMAAMIKR